MWATRELRNRRLRGGQHLASELTRPIWDRLPRGLQDDLTRWLPECEYIKNKQALKRANSRN